MLILSLIGVLACCERAGISETPETPNNPPTVTISADKTTGYAPLKVNFTAVGSDSDGEIVSYDWDFGDGQTEKGRTADNTYNAVGAYTAKCTVMDDDNATDSDTIEITVSSPPNKPPTAKVSANPASGQAPLTVNFKGADSTDSDGTIISYAWTFGDGGTSNIANPTHIYQKAGSYTATLTVTDDDGAKGTASINISVQAPPPPSPPAVDVRIDYIHYDAPGNDNENPNGEWVTIRNYGNTINLKDWTLRDVANHIYKFYSFTLSSGGTVYLYSGQGTDTTTKLYWGYKHAVWNNEGDIAYLRDNTGKLIDIYSY